MIVLFEKDKDKIEKDDILMITGDTILCNTRHNQKYIKCKN